MAIEEMGLGDLRMELPNTRKTLERVPTDRLDWRPHEKSFSLGELAQHIAQLADWGVMIVETDGLDLAEPFPEREPLTSTAEILSTFDEKTAAMMTVLEDADESDLAESWTLRNGDEELMSLSKAANLRSWVVNHMVHHRAQLTVYLRLLEQPVPALYGPSADEEAF